MAKTSKEQGGRMSKKKAFKPCSDDIDYISEALLEDNNDVTSDRLAILNYIYQNYPDIFWEAYGETL